MKLGVLFISLALLTGTAAAATPANYWSTSKVLRKLDGTRIAIGARTVHVSSATTLCAGEGPSIRRRGIRLWRRFVCTYTTFRNGVVDRDLDFRVRVLGATRFAIRDAHWVRASR